MGDYIESGLKKVGITISKPMLAMICILSGMLVILFPSLIVWVVGLFLIFQGALLFTDLLESERMGTTAESEGVYCSNCRTRNTKEAVYCKKCGMRLKPVNQRELKDYQESTITVTS